MRRFTHSLLLYAGILSSAIAQSPVPGHGWDRLQALPIGTRMHVDADRLSRTCVLQAVADDQLTCSKTRVVNTAHYTFPRAEVRSVKLTRYTLSAVGGFGIGLGAGAGIAGAAIKSDSFKSLGVAIFGVGGAVVGALALGPTDAFRGPLIYRR